MTSNRLGLIVVGTNLWLMMILLGSIVLETFMVYPNIFHDPPVSLTTALSFMQARTPSDFYPPLGFLSWVLGGASTLAARRTHAARRWILLSVAMIVCDGALSMAFMWPRNTIMFVEGPAVHSPEVLRQVALEFVRLHWLRVAFLAIASVTAFAAFLACYRVWSLATAGEDLRMQSARSTRVVDASLDERRQPAGGRVGRLVLTGVSIAIVIGTAIADLSGLHAQNQAWPPHARFHAIWHVFHVAAVQAVAMAWLWWASRRDAIEPISPAAGLLVAYVVSFLGAAVVTSLFGASITPDVPPERMPARPLGLDGNLLSVLIVTPIIVMGWRLARQPGARRQDRAGGSVVADRR